MPSPSVRFVKRRPSARSGFSLIESLAVVTIIGMMAAAVMPGMTDMVASTRQHSAADEVLLLARQARREALLGGKYAHSLVYQQVLGNGTGALQIVTGITGHCNRSSGVNFGNDPWTGVVLPVGWQSAMGGMIIGELSFGSHRIFGVMEMPENQVLAGLVICYAANGETHVVGGGVNGEQTQAAVLRIRRDISGVQKGIERQIVFMPGGTARLR